MFFIQNSEGTIVAADKDFLDAAGFESLLLLAEHFRTEHIGPDPEHGLLELDDATYTFAVRTVHTLWGDGLLFERDTSAEAPSAEPETSEPETSETVTDKEEELPAIVDTAEAGEALSEESAPPESETAPAEPETSQEETPELTSKEEETLDDVLELMDLEEIEEETETAETDLQPAPSAEEQSDGPGLKEAALGGAAGLGAAAALKAAESFLADEETPAAETEPKASGEEEELFELLDLSESEEKQTEEAADELPDDEMIRLLDDTEEKQEAAADAEPFGLLEQADEDRAEPEADEAPLELAGQVQADTPRAEDETPADEAPEEHAPADEHTGEPPLADTSGIVYEQNARLIGISTEEYLTFLDQFVEESYRFEPGLRGRDLREFRSSLASLKDASQLLHLPRLTEKLRKLEEATSDEKEAIADEYYLLIEQIKSDLKAYESAPPLETPPGQEPIEATPETEPPHDEHAAQPETAEEPPLELLSDAVPAEEEAPADTAPEAQPTPSAEQMSMQEVDALIEKATPIPFDFSTNVASEELGLPETLVGEFVDDFIEQARENIPLILSAHQKGDMETVQSTAHLLKGAAANLRIDPLAKTLETLQHNEDPEKVPALFDRFVGQLKALNNLLHPHGLN